MGEARGKSFNNKMIIDNDIILKIEYPDHSLKYEGVFPDGFDRRLIF